MKLWRHRYQFLFIILISFWGITFPTYVLFSGLEEMDVFRSPHFEDPFQDELMTNIENKWIGSGWISSAIIFPKAGEISEPFPVILLCPSSLEKNPTLRC